MFISGNKKTEVNNEVMLNQQDLFLIPDQPTKLLLQQNIGVINSYVKPCSSFWEMYRHSVFFPGFKGSTDDLILQVSMAIFARTNRFAVIHKLYSSSERFNLSPRHFHLVQFSPYMSDLNLFEILYNDFENKGYLRCEHFLNPMSISDLEDPVTSEQKRLFNRCRDAIVEQAKSTPTGRT